MNDHDKNLPAKRDDLSLTRPDSPLNEAYSKLPKEQQEKYLSQFIETQMDIDAEAARAALQNEQDSVEIVKTIGLLKALEETTNKDLTFTAEQETVIGKRKLEVKKSNNTVIIVIAIVIGIILLLMFAN